jgi:hypothetical protein
MIVVDIGTSPFKVSYINAPGRTAVSSASQRVDVTVPWSSLAAAVSGRILVIGEPRSVEIWSLSLRCSQTANRNRGGQPVAFLNFLPPACLSAWLSRRVRVCAAGGVTPKGVVTKLTR